MLTVPATEPALWSLQLTWQAVEHQQRQTATHQQQLGNRFKSEWRAYRPQPRRQRGGTQSPQPDAAQPRPGRYLSIRAEILFSGDLGAETGQIKKQQDKTANEQWQRQMLTEAA